MMATPKRRGRARIILSITDTDRIKRRLLGTLNGQPSRFGFVASNPWADHCIAMIELGFIPTRKKMRKLEADLYDKGIYPPGGPETTMVENDHLRFVPPCYNRDPIEEYEDNLTLQQGVKLPSSCSAIMLQRARLCKARRPERRRLRYSRK